MPKTNSIKNQYKSKPCRDLLGIVGSHLTIFKLEPAIPNMSQHDGQTASNMLWPTMLRYVAFAFCNRLSITMTVATKPKLFLRPLFLPHFNKASTIPGRKVGYSSNFLVECAARTLKPVPYTKPKSVIPHTHSHLSQN